MENIQLKPKFEYRRDLDGLRGVAVILVILHHFRLGCHGGYVGVDVFFVLSGYLITSKIYQEISQGSFSFVNFWKRRVNRLLPVSLITSFLTIIIGWFVLLPADYLKLGEAGVAHTTVISNIYFMKNVVYFSPITTNFPTLHYWSLAVEEQFYIFFPLALLVLLKWFRRRHKLIISLSVVLSFVLCVYASREYTSAHYYLLPTRAWQIGLGTLIAIFGVDRCRISKGLSVVLFLVGLLSIIYSAFVFTELTVFPSEYALVPCLGTALIIIGGKQTQVADYILCNKVIVFIGLISYPLYLWHWPIYSLLNYPLFGSTREDLLLTISAILLCSVLAILSWRYVEKIFRKKGRLNAKFYSCIGGSVVVLILSFTLIYSDGAMKRVDPEVMTILQNSKKGTSIAVDAKSFKESSAKIIGNGYAELDFLIWGDSHAGRLYEPMQNWAERNDRTGYVLSCPGTSPLLDFQSNNLLAARHYAKSYNDEVLQLIKNQKPNTVFLIAIWNHLASKEQVSKSAMALQKTVEAVKQIGLEVYIIRQPPSFNMSVPQRLAWATWKGLSAEKIALKMTEDRQNILFKEAGVLDHVITVDKLSSITPAKIYQYYSDSHHLNQNGTALVVDQITTVLAK